MIKKLATITKAGLEIKNRGILTFWLMVDYEDGLSQGVGGNALDQYDKKLKTRVGTTYGTQMIIELLQLLDVNNLHEATGQNIWVLGKDEGFNFKPLGIQALRNGTGKKLIFSEVAR